eukprot:m.13089 g.13089  ORF g.13089 m.13089 type:complete len:371 (-) comp8012_c0_seq1:219-1331(-)
MPWGNRVSAATKHRMKYEYLNDNPFTTKGATANWNKVADQYTPVTLDDIQAANLKVQWRVCYGNSFPIVILSEVQALATKLREEKALKEASEKEAALVAQHGPEKLAEIRAAEAIAKQAAVDTAAAAETRRRTVLQISHLMQLVVDGSAGLNDSQVKRPAPVPPTMSKKEAEEWFGLKPSKLPTGEKVGGRWQYPTADVVASFRSLGAPTSTLTRRGWGVYSGNTRASLEAALTKLNPADAPAIRREAAKTVTTRLNKGAMEAAAKLKDAEAAAATATRNVTHATTLLGLSAPTAAPVSTLGTAMQPAGVAEAAASAIEVAESSDDEVGGWPSPPLSEAKRGKGKAKRGFTELDEEDEWIPNGEEKRGRF